MENEEKKLWGDLYKSSEVQNPMRSGVSQENEPVRTFEHDGTVFTCAFSPDNEWVASGGDDKKLIVRNLKTGDIKHTFEHDGWIRTCAFSPDNQWVASGGADNKLTVQLFLADSNIKKWAKAPNLKYRDGDTILHHFQKTNLRNAFRSLLQASNRIYPIENANKQSILDIALAKSDHELSALIVAKLFERFPNELTPACVGLDTKTGKNSSIDKYPDVLVQTLQLCKRDSPWTRKVSRLTLKSKYKYKPSMCCRLVEWATDEDGDDGGTDVPVSSYVIGMKGFLALDGPFDSIVRSENLKAMETDTMRYAVDFKWHRYGRTVQIVRTCLFLCLVGWFSVDQGILDGNKPTLAVAPYMTVLLSFSFFHEEGRQLWKDGVAAHFSSGWNVLDLCAYTMAVGAVAVSRLYDRATEPAVNVVSSCAIIVLSFQFLNFLRAFEWSGSLVRMMTQIISDMRPFLALQIVLLVGFTTSFSRLLAKGDDNFKSWSSFLTGYDMLLGNWDIDQFIGASDVTSNAALIAGSLYMFLVPIVTMNLLIAIMSDSYDRVRDNQRLEARLQKAMVLVDIDRTYGGLLKRFFGESIYPVYLHVLAPTDENVSFGSADDQWDGRLKAIQTGVKEAVAEVKSNVKDMENKMEGVEKDVKGIEKDVKGIENKMEGIERKLDRVLQQLLKS